MTSRPSAASCKTSFGAQGYHVVEAADGEARWMLSSPPQSI